METKQQVTVIVVINTKEGEKVFRFFEPKSIMVMKGDKMLINEVSKKETPK